MMYVVRLVYKEDNTQYFGPFQTYLQGREWAEAMQRYSRVKAESYTVRLVNKA